MYKRQEVDRLARLINDLLNLSTLESGNVELEITSFDIIKLIRDQVDYFQPLFARKRLNVEIIYDEKELYVVSDKDRVIQVLVNLIDNAIKYCNEKGIVKIEVKISRDKVFICIYNSGPSISEDGLKHIWERFYKGDKSRTIKESTGLGLSPPNKLHILSAASDSPTPYIFISFETNTLLALFFIYGTTLLLNIGINSYYKHG